MNLIIEYLGAGRLERDYRVKHKTVTIVVGNLLEITNKIIPFFNQYPIFGVKSLDYLDWVKIANLIKLGKNKKLEEIKEIKKGMNKSRKINI